MSSDYKIIQIRRGLDSEFASANPILHSGEPAYAIDTQVLKIGDGATSWNSLDPFGAELSGVLTSSITDQINNLIDGAPDTLNTLNEIAAAIGDNASFINTFNALSNKTNAVSGVAIYASGIADEAYEIAEFASGVSVYASGIGEQADALSSYASGVAVYASGLAEFASSEIMVEISASGQVNNWDIASSSANFIKITPVSFLTITGIDSGYDYKRFTMLNNSSSTNITLVPLAGSSSVGNRLRFPESVGTILYPKEKAEFIYDNINSEWLVLKLGVSSNTKPVSNNYNGASSAVVSGVFNIVICSQDTYNNQSSYDPNTIYFVP